MKLIQVGVRGFGTYWLKLIAKNPEKYRFAALVDINPLALRAAADEVGVPHSLCFPDLASAIAAVDAEAVVLVVPPAFRRDLVIRALEAGLPVLSEKPMGDTQADCEAMLAAARRTGVEFAISQNYRYRPAVTTARRILASGELGAIGQARCDFWLEHDFRGTFRETMAYPLIVDMAIHHFDLVRYLTGLEPVSVRADSWNPPWSQFKGDASAACLFTMANGARVLYNASWHARGQHDDWNCTWLIECEHGFLRLHKGRLSIGRGATATQASESEVAVDLDAMPTREQECVLDDFVAAVRERRHALTTAEDNILSMAMVFNALESIGSQCSVDFARRSTARA